MSERIQLDGDRECRYLTATMAAETREVNGGTKRVIRGCAARFDSESELLGGWFRERISRGAFEGADLSDVIAAFNHNEEKILARTGSGTLKLEVTDEGLMYEFDCPDTSYGNDLWESVSRGDISKSSFMFTVAPGGTVWETMEGYELRTIMRFGKIYDVSPVVRPAYADTDVARRSYDAEKSEARKDMEDWRLTQRKLTLAKMQVC